MRTVLEGTTKGCLAFTIIMLVLSVPAWLTHCVTCILSEQWVLLAIGAVIAPVGVVHGWMIWFGLV